MKTALVGSSGYIADFIMKRFVKEQDIESVLKIDRNETADAILDLFEAEKGCMKGSYTGKLFMRRFFPSVKKR